MLQSPCLHIHLAQVGHFNNKVIYASVQEESDGVNHLRFLWQSLRDGCQAAGIKLVDGDRFTPHMTILKLSKDPKIFRKVLKKTLRLHYFEYENFLEIEPFCSQGIKAVAPHLYETHVDCIFGRQVYMVRNQLLKRDYSRSFLGDRECSAAVDDRTKGR